ncbi:MAG: hypothetical protein K0U72_12000 [Gammaproteobacteria bacterium]|nr:hypothetical protein [Gammaproteobacteria bacterium]
MRKPSIFAALLCLNAACTTVPETVVAEASEPAVIKVSPGTVTVAETEPAPAPDAIELQQWMRQLIRIETLFGLELAGERDRLLVQHREHPTDGSRLALAYLLSRPQVLVHDMDRSRELLAEIDAGGAYAPVRDLLLREFAMVEEIAELQTQTSHLESQLEALKAIEADLSDNQQELEDLDQ